MLVKIQTGFENYNSVTNTEVFTDISLIFADIKLIKCKYDNLSIDISINNFVGFTKLILMDYIEDKIAQKFSNKFLFKRTLILIKAWCYYEGCILGSNISLMANYALEVIVIYVFNNYHHLFVNELDAFFTFVAVMAEFDWDNQILHIFGSITNEIFNDKTKNIEDSTTETVTNDALWYLTDKMKTRIEGNFILSCDVLLKIGKEFEKFKELEKIHNFNLSKKCITLKYVNIIDPIFNNNNLGKSINLHNFTKIKKIFEFLKSDVENIKLSRNITTPIKHLNSLLKLFSKSITLQYPELLFFFLPHPKIIINPYLNLQDESVTKNNYNKINPNDSNKNNMSGNIEGFTSLNGNIISNFNKVFTINKSKNNGMNLLINIFNDFEESKYSNSPLSNFGTNNIYTTKEIIDYITNNLDRENNEKTYAYINYYQRSNLEEFLNSLK